MSRFTRCRGQTACRDDGTQCLTCGRSFEEITRTRELIDGLVELAIAHDYDNVGEFAAYVAARVKMKVRFRLAGAGDG